ncbi:uncharacterized protein cubi_02146 [Cryptosporidium ubiquitum]|uniref:Uncharacterized protein n=1 Tax=Cryptosporidium ubiquitum TaxID=857276 RepID=A0A1J4MHH8_9CRYT|nr:uncharacterized protein cubi_02146 [Cryptosporidium ubiquitum]OII72915.1 hypothetical protein cubi_02146 [Cryptosporidium ubiquitum]
MPGISCILYSGIYEVLVEYLDCEDVYELALLSVEWGHYLGGSFIRYWQKASTDKFGFRFDLVKVLVDGVAKNNDEFEDFGNSRSIKSWFGYFEFLNTSELGMFLFNQKKINEVLQVLLYKLKFELNSANSCFSIQNSSNLESVFAFNKFIENNTSRSNNHVSEASPFTCEFWKEHKLKDVFINGKDEIFFGLTSFSNIELDFGGLGKGYIWDMEVNSITSQNIVLKSEFQIEDIPYWDIGKVIMEYIAVWGLFNENEHVLLYHHKNPFHKIDNGIQLSNNCHALLLSNGNKISDLNGINYFLSSLSSFAGIEMSINEALSKITIYITLQVVFILENLKNHFSSNSKNLLNSNKPIKSIQDSDKCNINVDFKENINTNNNIIEGIQQDNMYLGVNNDVLAEKYKTKEYSNYDFLDFEYEYDNLLTQKSLLLLEDGDHTLDENHIIPSSSLTCRDKLDSNLLRNEHSQRHKPSLLSFRPKLKLIPFKLMNNRYTKSYYNIELQLMDTRASIPLYLYGDLEPAGGSTNKNFAELRVYFGRNYPNSSYIKTNCLYQAGISVIDKATGEIVFSLVFPKSKSYYDRRTISKSRRLLKLCSYSRVYSTQVPVIDPPSQLTNMPESVFSKLEILIHPHKSSLGKVSELSVSLNLQECLALFPVKKFKKFLSLQGFQSHDQYKRRINSPIKNIQKY